MDSYKLACAIEDFRARMDALGIDVAAIEVANDASKHAVLATLQPACPVLEQANFKEGVLARICGVKIKAAEARRQTCLEATAAAGSTAT